MAQMVPAPSTVKVYYGKPILPDVSRVLACLYEKEIDFQLVDMYKGQRMPAEILKLQATMKAPVPAFEDSNKLLLESRAICRYVAETYADQGTRYLLGRDLLERGSIEQWLKTEEQSFHPPSWTIVFHLAFNPLTYVNEQDQSLIAQSGRMLAQVLDVYEHRLGESKYLAGDDFTLADLSHLPNAHYLANSEEWRYLFTSRKNVQRWWEKISSRHSWEKVVGMLKGDASSVAEDVATSQDKSPERQSAVSSGSPTIHLNRLSKPPARASLTASTEASSEVGQPRQSDSSTGQPTHAATELKPGDDARAPKGDLSNGQSTKLDLGADATDPKAADSKAQLKETQPSQGDLPVSQPISDTTQSKQREGTLSKPQSATSPQPRQSDSSTGQPTPAVTQSKPGDDALAPKGDLSNGRSTKLDLGADATDPKPADSKPQLKESQLSQGDLPVSQPISDTTQSKQREGTLSNPQSATSPQPQQATDQSKNTTKESNKGVDASIDQSNTPENPDIQKISQSDSTAPSVTSNKPNAQSSVDDTPKS